MILWILILSLILIVSAIPLVAIGAYKKFKQKSEETIYLILFVTGCIFAGFGFLFLIVSLVSGNNKDVYYEYLPRVPYPRHQMNYNFHQRTMPIFNPIYENLGWTSNPE